MDSLRDGLQSSLGSNYTIERELGGGGMSRVFLARDLTLDRGVVVKLLSAESTSGVSADRFRREIQVIARLQHPHVVSILSAGAFDAGLYYVMPYLSGETVRARLAREGPLPVSLAVRIIREVLDALAFAHSHGVIHRDIKPENVLLEAGHAVVADFGVAKALHESGSMTSIGVALGTPAYMAPEQAAGDNTMDHRVDLYAVGVLAYEMLTGQPPFSGSPTQVIRAHMTEAPTPILQRRSDVPASVAQLVMRALEKEPGDRPASAHEMLSALESVTTPGATQPTMAERFSRAPKRRSRMLLAGAGLLIATATASVLYASRGSVRASAQSMAIAPFAVASDDTALTRMGQNLVTTVGANLDGVGDIRIADGISVLSHARSRGTLLSAEQAREIAQKVGALSVVHGTLVQQGSMVRADAALYEVDGANPVARVSVIAPRDSLAALTDSLTWHLLRAVWQRGNAPTPTVTAITTHNQTALREFIEGDRLFSRSQVLEAAEAYKRAVAADTTFWFAHFRYRYARAWMGVESDTGIVRRLSRHVMDLPERERALVATMDSTMTISERVAAYRRLVARYPDFVPAWFVLADQLIHHAMRVGIPVREAIGPWQRAAHLVPEDFEAANHWLTACVAAGDPCADTAFRNYDRLARSDSAPPAPVREFHRTMLTVFTPPRPGLADSLIAAGRRDSAMASVTGPWIAILMPATVARPDLMATWDTLNAEAFERAPTTTNRFIFAHNRVVRGEWSAIDEMIRLAPQLPWPTSVFHPISAVRMRALGELQEMLPPSPRTATVALEYTQGRGTPRARQLDGQWIAGLSSLLRGDTSALNRRLRDLDRDTTVHARITRRSLRAIAMGRAGSRAQAAESLLVLERDHGEYPFKVWGAFAADRLLAAEWLAEQGQYAPADSLLQFTEGFTILGTFEAAHAVLPTAYLLRSRIAEGRGDPEAAVKYATMFLRLFDKAPASKQAWIDEANARVARLTPAETRR